MFVVFLMSGVIVDCIFSKNLTILIVFRGVFLEKCITKHATKNGKLLTNVSSLL